MSNTPPPPEEPLPAEIPADVLHDLREIEDEQRRRSQQHPVIEFQPPPSPQAIRSRFGGVWPIF